MKEIKGADFSEDGLCPANTLQAALQAPAFFTGIENDLRPSDKLEGVDIEECGSISPIQEMILFNEQETADYIRMKDGWKEGTEQWQTYDLVVRVLTKHHEYLSQLLPVEQNYKSSPAPALQELGEEEKDISANLPEHGIEVLGYSDQWVDEDYNKKGVRICFHNDGNWISTYWNNIHDCYETDTITSPNKYRLI